MLCLFDAINLFTRPWLILKNFCWRFWEPWKDIRVLCMLDTKYIALFFHCFMIEYVYFFYYRWLTRNKIFCGVGPATCLGLEVKFHIKGDNPRFVLFVAIEIFNLKFYIFTSTLFLIDDSQSKNSTRISISKQNSLRHCTVLKATASAN